MSTTKKADPSAVPGIQTQTLEQSLRAKKAPAPVMTSLPPSTDPTPVAPPSETTPEATVLTVHSNPDPPANKRYKVLETVDIPRGASTFRLPKGKVVSAQGYDIAFLKACGAQLEEVSA